MDSVLSSTRRILIAKSLKVRGSSGFHGLHHLAGQNEGLSHIYLSCRYISTLFEPPERTTAKDSENTWRFSWPLRNRIESLVCHDLIRDKSANPPYRLWLADLYQNFLRIEGLGLNAPELYATCD